jgi:hypothetical protein
MADIIANFEPGTVATAGITIFVSDTRVLVIMTV